MRAWWIGVIASVLGTAATPQDADAFFRRGCWQQTTCSTGPGVQTVQAPLDPANPPPGYRVIPRTRTVTEWVPTQVQDSPGGPPRTVMRPVARQVTENVLLPENSPEVQIFDLNREVGQLRDQLGQPPFSKEKSVRSELENKAPKDKK